MRLLRHTDVPVTTRDLVFQYSRTRALVFSLMLFVAGLALVWVGWQQRFWLPFVIAGTLFLGWPAFRGVVTARFRRSNWLVRAGDTGLWVQFRSYLNYHFPADDLTVVSIPYREINSARLVRQRRDLPDRDGGGGVTESRRRVVELELDMDSAELRTALRDELGRKGPKERRWWGSSATRYGHCPVRLSSPTTLEIEWNVGPSFRLLFERLALHSNILPAARVQHDLTRLDEKGRSAQETRLRELVELGETMAAVQIARRLYGYDLTEATRFVEGLRGGNRR